MTVCRTMLFFLLPGWPFESGYYLTTESKRGFIVLGEVAYIVRGKNSWNIMVKEGKTEVEKRRPINI